MSPTNPPLGRPLRMALIGGGGSGFIGRVHAAAALLDRRAQLVAGALSSLPDRAQAAAAEFGIEPDRAFGSYRELIDFASRLPPDQRIDFVTVATPNHTHFPIAHAALQAGLNVVCEKPMTVDLGQAQTLARLVEETGAVFALAHAYSAFPLVRQAREMVHSGELGTVQAVRVHYLQGGLRGLVPGQPPPRAAWKADPSLAGPSGAMSDIGTHAYHLTCFVTGLAPRAVSCHLRTYHPARPLDDYGHAVIRFEGEALGTLTVSQATHGRLNDLSLEVDGTAGSLAWRQEAPDQLVVRRFGQPVQVYERSTRAGYLSGAGRAACRLPGGHPEGLLEAFANLYCDCFDAMVLRATGHAAVLRDSRYPNVHAGLAGVLFVQQCLSSHRADGAWMPLC